MVLVVGLCIVIVVLIAVVIGLLLVMKDMEGTDNGGVDFWNRRIVIPEPGPDADEEPWRLGPGKVWHLPERPSVVVEPGTARRVMDELMVADPVEGSHASLARHGMIRACEDGCMWVPVEEPDGWSVRA